MKKLALALLLFPTLALAQPGTYFQGQLGGVYLVDGNHFDFLFGPTGATGRASVGHLWGNTNVNYGVEAGLAYFSHASSTISIFGDNTLSYSGYTSDILGVLKYNFDNGFNIFGKAGLAYLSQSSNQTGSVMGTIVYQNATSGNKVGPEFAIGAGYQFTPNWEMNLTESTVLVSGVSAGNPVATTNMFLLGLAYHLS